MTLQLGENPWFLILLTFLELLLILIPAVFASKIEKKSFKEELIEMGFRKSAESLKMMFIKIISGLIFGFFFFLINGYILFFFRDLIFGKLFGNAFVTCSKEGSINTKPIKPSLIQIIIIVILLIVIVGPCEEGFFRGFIIEKCNKKIKKIYSILISSVCFAIFHLPPFLVPPTTFIVLFGYYFTFGIILALIYIIFDNSLIPCTIAHATFNVLIFLL